MPHGQESSLEKGCSWDALIVGESATVAVKRWQEKITDIEAWMSELVGDAKEAAQTTATEVETEKMDSRLAHLIEAKSSI